jgi:hypothetical protein
VRQSVAGSIRDGRPFTVVVANGETQGFWRLTNLQATAKGGASSGNRLFVCP